jgi:hypothetical protein
MLTSGADIINDGNWHHLVHVANRNGNMTTYLDGVDVDAHAISYVTGSVDPGHPANIGQDGTGIMAVSAAEAGDIDDVGVWTRQLSNLEVSGMYLAAKNHSVSFAPAPVTIIAPAVGATTLSYTGGVGSLFKLYSSSDLVHWTLVGVTAQTSTPGSFSPISAIGSAGPVYYRVTSE